MAESLFDSIFKDVYARYEAPPLMVWRGRTVVHGPGGTYRTAWLKQGLHGRNYGMAPARLVADPDVHAVYEVLLPPITGHHQVTYDVETAPMTGRFTARLDNLVRRG